MVFIWQQAKIIWEKDNIYGCGTQLLLGIKGARWDVRPIYAEYYYEFWCRPSVAAVPVVVTKVENTCYC